MKRVCIMVDCDDDRSELLIAACCINAATQMNGLLRSAYVIHAQPPRNLFERVLDALRLRTAAITELYPPRIEDASDELAKDYQ
mgnify:CR=1 FL=1